MLSVITSKKLLGIQKCSQKGSHKVKDLFKTALKHFDLWEQAYADCYANKGAITKGIGNTTMDGCAVDRFINLIKLLEQGRYEPKPSRKVAIPKPSGGIRKLGLPSGDDKLVQGVWRIILEAVYEPIFKDQSHGFRPGRSCHTALEQIDEWNGVKWFLEFDIKGFYDNIDHQLMLNILEKKIDDWRFLKVIRKMLKAGYLEDWQFHKSLSGTPQGGIVSPILANIYLHELDEFILSIPYDKGKRRAENTNYRRILNAKRIISKKIDRAKQKGQSDKVKDLIKEWKELGVIQRDITCGDQYDPNYRRLWYSRYADDLLIGLIGPKYEAEQIMEQTKSFIKSELHLETSVEKTGIVHAKEGKVLYLGYEIGTESSKQVRQITVWGKHTKKRTFRDQLVLRVPKNKVEKFCNKCGYGNLNSHSSTHRSNLLYLSDAEIVLAYNAELRGIANYYTLANDVKKKLHYLFFIAHSSLYKTLACKHKCSVVSIIKRLDCGTYKAIRTTVNGKSKEYRIFQLKNLDRKPIQHKHLDKLLTPVIYQGYTELIERLNARRCEFCGKSDGYFEVHHIRKVKEIKEGKQKWQKIMGARNRKTLVLCIECHHLLHNGMLPDWRFLSNKVKSAVR